MGHIYKKIAKITEPKDITLATNPNFVIFESLWEEYKYPEADISVVIEEFNEQRPSATLRITDSANNKHEFLCEGQIDHEGNYDADKTTKHFLQVLQKNGWMTDHFEIVLKDDNNINLKGKKKGEIYEIRKSFGLNVNWINKEAWMNDSILAQGESSETNTGIAGEKYKTEIELSVYQKAEDWTTTSIPNNSDRGTLFATVQKTYLQGEPLWFDLNALFAKQTTYNLPSVSGWFDTGTLSDYRFIATVKGENSLPFYGSDLLYVLNGYGYSLKPTQLLPYIWNGRTKVKLLSNKTNGKYVRGQKEYINFIVSRDDEKDIENLKIAYKLSSYSGNPIATLYDHEVKLSDLSIVNTCVVDLTDALADHPNTGKVEIFLTQEQKRISESLTLEILPECLHQLNTFVFLNKLGGWDSFNADAETQTENKRTSETYNQTITPYRRVGDGIEIAYNVDLEITHVVETPLLDAQTRIWLREFLASPAILDGEGNYILLQDAKLSTSSGMETFEFKYKLSDKYNG